LQFSLQATSPETSGYTLVHKRDTKTGDLMTKYIRTVYMSFTDGRITSVQEP